MKRTQIQLPDQLFDSARQLAASKEISMAELVRRGLEYMLAVSPEARPAAPKWKLPQGHDLQSQDPFGHPDWRADLHTGHLRVAEEHDDYDAGADE